MILAYLLIRKILQKIYGFDQWHIGPLQIREYALDIIDNLNNRREKQSIVEVGCGLGDIIRNVNFKSKLCLDSDEKVLSANRFLSYFQNVGGERIEFCKFDLLCDRLNGIFDVIVMVNWIHNVQPMVLKEKMQKLFQHNLKVGGVLVFDVVNNPSYQFNHNANDLLDGLGEHIEVLGPYQYGRSIIFAHKAGQ